MPRNYRYVDVEKALDLAAEKSSSVHSWPNFPKTKINLIVYLRYCTDNSSNRGLVPHKFSGTSGTSGILKKPVSPASQSS